MYIAVSNRGLARGARRGMGAVPLAQWCDQASWFNPLAIALCLPHDVAKVGANVYQQVEYGHIPTPAELPAPPAPNAPQSIDELTLPGDWTPEQAQPTAEQYQSWTEAQRQALANAQSSGQWNPQGNLPTNPLDLSALWEKYKAPLLIGGAVLGFVVVKGIGARR